jgi:hypothetical protein
VPQCQCQYIPRGVGDLENEVRFSRSALVRPSVAHGGTLGARRRPANGRRRSPGIIRTLLKAVLPRGTSEFTRKFGRKYPEMGLQLNKPIGLRG